MSDTLGIYLHIPFCRQKCNYCDFCSLPARPVEEWNAYIDALCTELRHRKDDARGRKISTVYVGGGTPSILPPSAYERVFQTINDTYSLADGAEITMEANPGTVDRPSLAPLLSLGVNRISFGVQSASDALLRTLGRIHTFGDAERAVTDARAVGFENISADLMYGLPDQTHEIFRETLDRVIAWDLPHLSCYTLIVEEGTPFFRMRDSLRLPDEDDEYRMYADATERLAAAGYEHYEISNYARPGYRSRHNFAYWRCGEYIGVGAAAHSYIAPYRFANTTDVSRYIASPTSSVVSRETIDDGAREYEYIMLGLRLSDGIDDAVFASRFGVGFYEKYAGKLEKYRAAGYVSRLGDVTRLTESGLYLSNAILADIL